MPGLPKSVVVAVALAAVSLVVGSQPAAAATIIVTSVLQEDPDPSRCTLTDAIRAAELDVAIGGCASGHGPDEIWLPAGTLTLTVPSVIDFFGNSTAFPVITQPLIIKGAGADQTIIERHQGSFFTFRFFHTRAVWLELHGLALVGGDVSPSYTGGAIYAEDTAVVLNGVRLENNRAQSGGALGDLGYFGTNGAEFTIVDSTVTGNAATHAGGAVSVSPAGSVTIVRSRLDGNTSINWGGAVYNHHGAAFSAVDSTFAANTAGADGGALHVHGPQLTRAIFTDNHAGVGGGALYSYGARPVIVDSTFRGNQAQRGGAIEVHGGSIDIAASTFAANRATSLDGGALRLDDRTRDSRIVNSTFSANLSGQRGAIALQSGALSINNSTIAFNAAVTAPGSWSAGLSAGFQGDTEISIANSIVAHNTNNGSPLDAFFDPASGGDRIVSLGHNIVGVDAWVNGVFTQDGDRVGTTEQPIDAGLLPLADNGGYTWTHALAPLSPALDHGGHDSPGSSSACLTIDQRGRVRPGPGSAACDTGAYEHGIYHALHLTVVGGGSVTGLPGAAACEGSCTAELGVGAEVTLTAHANPGFTLVHWAGACSDDSPTCAITMHGAQNVTATFAAAGGGTTTTLTTSPNPSAVNEAVVLTASVVPLAGALGTPTGQVRFVDTTVPAVIGTSTLDANGTAVLTIGTLPEGQRVIQALYGGDDLFSGSSSPPRSHRVGVLANVAPSFAMPAFAPAIDEDAGVQLFAHFASALMAGPDYESAQSFVGFTVTPINTIGNITFTSGPVVALDGTLTYEVARNTNGLATFRVTLQDDGGTDDGGQDTSAPQDFTITVTAINDAPVSTVPGPHTVDERTSLVFGIAAANAISISDVDDAENSIIGDETVAVSLAASNGTLVLSATTGLTFSAGSNGSSAMTVTGAIGNINSALDGLTYTPALEFSGAAALTITTTDLGNFGGGGPLADVDVVTITVTAVNEAPVNTAPGAASATSNGTLIFSAVNGNPISVTDPDDTSNGIVGDQPMQVTLSAGRGTLTLNGITGLSFTFSDANGTGAGDGTSDATLRFRGSLASINTALNGLSYAPATGFSGADTLSIAANDLGNFGTGGALSDLDLVVLTIVEPNQPPALIVPGPQSTALNTARVLSAATGNGIAVADTDDADNGIVGDEPVQVSLTVGHGTLTTNGVAGLSFAFSDAHGSGDGDGTADATMRFRGSLSDVNAALNGLAYQPAASFRGADTVTVVVSDLGNFGPGGALTATAGIALTIGPPNQAPTLIAPGAQSVSDVATLTFSTGAGNPISVADPDDTDNGVIGDELVQVALATQGRLTLSTVAGLSFAFNDANGTGTGDGTSDASMHFRGSLASVNAALNGLTYVSADGFSGTDTLTIVANDLGNFGAGSARTAVTTVSITVVPQPRISIADASIVESDGPVVQMTFTVTLSSPSAETVTARYSTANGAPPNGASAGADYLTIAGVVTFAPGTLSQTFAVPVVGDKLYELTEAFTVRLTLPANGALGDSEAVGTIIDNEAEPRLSISDVSVQERDNARQATFVVTLSGSTAVPVTVDFATSPITAREVQDYESAAGSVIFQPGEDTKSIPVSVRPDNLDEDDETFAVNLAGAAGAAVSDAQGVGTIVDNDPLPLLGVRDVIGEEPSSGSTPFEFIVRLSERSDRTVTVRYEAGHPRNPSSDFVAASGTLTFAAGEVTKSFSVLVNADSIAEDVETFRVALSDPINARLGSSATATGTIYSEERPRLTSFTPGAGAVGTVVTIRGLHLTAVTTVMFGEQRAAFTALDDTTISAIVPMQARDASLSVTSPDGSASTTTSFNVIDIPRITSLSTPYGPIGSTVDIMGTGFADVTSIRFGAIEVAFTRNSSSFVRVTVPPGARSGLITVSSEAGSDSKPFGVSPAIIDFAPAGGVAGTVVTIRGTSFTDVDRVRIGGFLAEVWTRIDDTTLRAKVPEGATPEPIAVFTPHSGSGYSAQVFNAIPRPWVRRYWPAKATTGTSVLVEGEHFLGATSVTFNGVAAEFTIDSDSMIRATVPNGATTGNLTVTGPGGPSTQQKQFVVEPTITSFSPAFGPPGTLIRIVGSGFSDVERVRVGGKVGVRTNPSPNEIYVTAPGYGFIKVETAAGTATSSTRFTATPQ